METPETERQLAKTTNEFERALPLLKELPLVLHTEAEFWDYDKKAAAGFGEIKSNADVGNDRYRPFACKHGGVCEVYAALDQETKRVVAMKRLKRGRHDDSYYIKLFENEIRTLAALRGHPQWVQLQALLNGDTMVLEFIPGISVKAVLAKLNRTKTLEMSLIPRAYLAALIARETAQAHIATRELGFIDIDIAPDNILLTSNEARFVDLNLLVDPKFHWRDGYIMGRFQYMSPEVASGNPPHSTSEFVSLGYVLYELLAGKNALIGDDDEFDLDELELVRRAQEMDFNPTRLSPYLPITPIILKLLAQDPHRRLQNAEELLAMLAPYAGSPRELAWFPDRSPIPEDIRVVQRTVRERFGQWLVKVGTRFASGEKR